jgi:hypothetical protein
VQPFWQQVVVQTVGPLVAAVVGTLIIGSIANDIARRAQQRREDRELRVGVITQMTEAASALYRMTQQLWRASEREHAAQRFVDGIRAALDNQYHKTRVAGEVIDSRLQVFFESDLPRCKWHATIDLLTLRYFQVTKQLNDAILQANARNDDPNDPNREHSGLTIEQLRNPGSAKMVLDAHHAALKEATLAVYTQPRPSP